ncbi:DUF58 domain-containing protein [Alienimonas chondri]|uniref:DUF58 domain-containing protein n=1 Tax=Alienimonas chondri TaxID=2681879 RepID=A0ABX1VIW2_9PLAN|nr:DUF58 domain-containing protein [Alienimonas chondri]NNJ28063.1 hypothetical protein [Alienimonas chondri]
MSAPPRPPADRPSSDRPIAPDPTALAAIARLPLGRRGLADGLLSGAHRGGRGGFSVEFAGHRPFQIGDDTRRIDWRKRRHVAAGTPVNGGWFVKQFEAESGLAVHLVVDASSGMAYRGPAADGGTGRHPSKWRVAATAAATLTEAVLQRRDAASLTVLGGNRVTLPTSAAPAHAAAVCDTLSGILPSGKIDFAEALGTAAGRWGRRGVVVILSDLLTDPDRWFAALSDLRRRGHEAAVLRVLAPAEVSFPFEKPRRFRPLTGDPAITGGGRAAVQEYRIAFEEHAAELAAASRRVAAPLTVMTTDEPLSGALVRFLSDRVGRA